MDRLTLNIFNRIALRRCGLVMMLLSFCLTLGAQSQTDVKVSEGAYNVTRTNISVAYNHSWSAVSDGFAASASYRFLTAKKFTLTANVRYSSTQTDFSAYQLSGTFDPEEIGINGIHIFAQTGFTSTFKSTLFGRPFNAMAMANAEWSGGGFARISGIAMAMFMLRSTRNTQFGIGPLVMVNTCSKLPAFLVFMYTHRFNQRLKINLYGGMFGLDYSPSRDDLLSIGADVDVKAYYFKTNADSLPSKCRFTSTLFRPMIKYRRQLANNLYFNIQGGIGLKMSCRVNGVTGSTEYIDCHMRPAPFVHTAISYSL